MVLVSEPSSCYASAPTSEVSSRAANTYSKFWPSVVSENRESVSRDGGKEEKK